MFQLRETFAVKYYTKPNIPNPYVSSIICRCYKNKHLANLTTLQFGISGKKGQCDWHS